MMCGGCAGYVGCVVVRHGVQQCMVCMETEEEWKNVSHIIGVIFSVIERVVMMCGGCVVLMCEGCVGCGGCVGFAADRGHGCVR